MCWGMYCWIFQYWCEFSVVIFQYFITLLAKLEKGLKIALCMCVYLCLCFCVHMFSSVHLCMYTVTGVTLVINQYIWNLVIGTTKPVLTGFHIPLNMTLYVAQSYYVIHEIKNIGIPISVVECHSTVWKSDNFTILFQVLDLWFYSLQGPRQAARWNWGEDGDVCVPSNYIHSFCDHVLLTWLEAHTCGVVLCSYNDLCSSISSKGNYEVMQQIFLKYSWNPSWRTPTHINMQFNFTCFLSAYCYLQLL
jgi:hypothetical protein